MSKKTFADELREENERLRRRFIYHTRPRRLLSIDEARELAERVADTSEQKAGE